MTKAELNTVPKFKFIPDVMWRSDRMLKVIAHIKDRPIRYTERFTEAGIDPSVGSVGYSYGNALAETMHGLFKTELVHCRGPWHNLQDLEIIILGWVEWFNNRRLLGPIGKTPPAEAEENFYAQPAVLDMVA